MAKTVCKRESLVGLIPWWQSENIVVGMLRAHITEAGGREHKVVCIIEWENLSRFKKKKQTYKLPRWCRISSFYSSKLLGRAIVLHMIWLASSISLLPWPYGIWAHSRAGYASSCILRAKLSSSLYHFWQTMGSWVWNSEIPGWLTLWGARTE